jgi:hypothetical protein
VCISLQSGSLGDWDGGGYGIHRYPGGGSPGSNSACALLFPTLLGGSLSTVQAATMAEALAPSPVSAAPRMIAVEAPCAIEMPEAGISCVRDLTSQ